MNVANSLGLAFCLNNCKGSVELSMWYPFISLSIYQLAAITLCHLFKTISKRAKSSGFKSLMWCSYILYFLILNKTLFWLVETGLHRQLSGPIPSHTPLPHTEHAEAAVLTLVRLCQVAPSLALICREALVNTSSLAELALHITVEIIHDEVEFLSRLIFSREATSQWILYHFGAKLKSGDSLPLPPLGEPRAPRGGTTHSGRTKDKEGSAARVRDALLADARHTWQVAGWGGRLHAHLRLYCVLVRAGDLNPSHEEVGLIAIL